MPGKLLILTFHQPGVLAGEDVRFKAEAIQSGLISGDAMDETGGNEPPGPYFADHEKDLLVDPKRPELGGITTAKLGGVSISSFNAIGVRTWGRRGYEFTPDADNPNVHDFSIFEEWMRRVLEVPVEVLVLAGHHSDSLVWGSQRQLRGEHFFYSAIVPSIDNSDVLFAMEGYGPGKNDKELRLRAGGIKMQTALSQCKLLVVFGCNGAMTGIKLWRDCIMKARGGLAPFIFGFYNTHLFPRDAGGEFVSPNLWSGLEALAPGMPGNKNLDFLDNVSFFGAIRDVWFDALKQSFPDGSPRRHLFFSGLQGNGSRGPRGAGVIDPEGTIWHIVDHDGNVDNVGTLS